MTDKILRVLDRLEFLGERYAVGGCVRDALMGLEPHDIDVATPLPPAEVIERAGRAGYTALPTGLAHGTVTLLPRHHGEESIEVTTYRIDAETNGRHATVRFTTDLEADLARRDFTINAMALAPNGACIDPHMGRWDLGRRRLSCVGDPWHRMHEDYLRALRGLRLIARFKLEPTKTSWDAVQAAVPFIRHMVSVERVVGEFTKAFAHDGAGEFVRLAYETGLLEDYIYQFHGMAEFKQHPVYHPEGSVLQHTCQVVENAPPCYRWHALLHDVGKPATAETVEGRDYYRYPGHEDEGAAQIDYYIADRLKFSKALKDSVVATTRHHMRPLHLWRDTGGNLTQRQIRRFQAACGEHLADVYEVVKADRTGREGPTDAFLTELFTPLKTATGESAVKPILRGKHLLERGFVEGPAVGKALKQAFEYQLETGEEDLQILLEVATC